MIVEAIKNIRSEKKDLRSFGLVIGIALGIIGGLLLWKENPAYVWLFGIGGAFVLLGLVVPIVLLPLHKVWMLIAGLIGWIMSRLILSVLFYAVLTPMSLVGRLFGKRFVQTRLDRSAGSYWNIREKLEPAAERESFEEQF